MFDTYIGFVWACFWFVVVVAAATGVYELYTKWRER